jgi:TonB family protein
MLLASRDPEIHRPIEDVRLLVELPSWGRTFFGNLRDLLLPAKHPELQLRSAPAAFWPDVFVKHRVPWYYMAESVVYHVIALALMIGLGRLFAMQPPAVARPTFDHNQVVYYQPSEYLPPLDTRTDKSEEASRADPEFSPQPIISVPPEADNRSQTVVTPPNVRLKRDVAVPNIVSWSDKQAKPQLAIPPVPLTPAAQISRIRPQVESPAVVPPPDPSQLTNRRTAVSLQESVVAPPPDVRSSRSAPALNAPEPAVVAPPPTVESATTRSLGDLNIGHSAIINAAPQLAVSEQRALAGGRSSAMRGVAPQVVPPPPAVGGSGSAGAPGRVIALSLHPAVGAPPTPPEGNRRGSFAAGPDGHVGASGSPGSSSGTAAAGTDGHGTGNGSGASHKSDLPGGLYVGNAPPTAKTSAVVGNAGASAPTQQVNPDLVASVHPPRVTSVPSRAMQPGDPAKLTEVERALFGERRFYSLTLNMPNLNSGGGSWVVRFAELHQDPRDPVAEISQPAAIRKVDPAYPLQLMKENVSGTVILYAVIHADGTVGNVRILRGVDDRLDRYAGEAVAQWKFTPATKNGNPVDVEATFHIPFRPALPGTRF